MRLTCARATKQRRKEARRQGPRRGMAGGTWRSGGPSVYLFILMLPSDASTSRRVAVYRAGARAGVGGQTRPAARLGRRRGWHGAGAAVTSRADDAWGDARRGRAGPALRRRGRGADVEGTGGRPGGGRGAGGCACVGDAGGARACCCFASSPAASGSGAALAVSGRSRLLARGAARTSVSSGPGPARPGPAYSGPRLCTCTGHPCRPAGGARARACLPSRS